MYRIGVIGHSPEYFIDPGAVQRTVERTIDLLSFQYDVDNMIFNIGGDIGVGLWAANYCRKNSYKYHLFIPFPLETTLEHWYDDQQRDLRLAYSHAYALSVGVVNSERKSTTVDNRTNQNVVDNSNFVIAFWMGKQQGHTFDTIHYAFKRQKLILNGLEELKLITDKDIKRVRRAGNRKRT